MRRSRPLRLEPLIAGVVLLLGHAAAAQDYSCDPTVAYPDNGWPDATMATTQAKGPQIAALQQYMFTLIEPDSAREGIRTDGLIIIQHGQMIFEQYGRGFTAQNKHLAWSVTKSLMHALVGIAVQHAVLAMTDSICQYLPNLPSESCAIRIADLMQLSSGLYWDEVYENESNQASSVLAMLYGQGHGDMATFVASQGPRFPVGSTWYYSTGDATLLGAVLDAAMKPFGGDLWEWPLFFNDMGITDTTLERDRSDHSVGGSLWWAYPRDLARFGYLYLHDGCWDGAHLLPSEWTQDATTVASAMTAGSTYQITPGEVYGHGWWLNIALPQVGQTTVPWPDVPTDAFYADGHWGQLIIVIPSHDMVIVRTGDDRDEAALDQDKFVALAMAVGD